LVRASSEAEACIGHISDAAAQEQTQHQFADQCQRVSGVSGAQRTTIFVQCHITVAVQTNLDLPVLAGER
jgi:hypothetical protein